MQIKFPLFVLAKDCGEIATYDSAHDLQFHVEKIDVENGEFEVWDKDGLPINLSVREPLWLGLEPASDQHDPEKLGGVLRKYAESVGVQLPDPLPVNAFESALDKIRDQNKKRMEEMNPLRRFLARF